MSTNPNNRPGGGIQIGFFGLLTLLLIACKLTGVVDWSWWWVLAPAYAPFALLFGLSAAFGIFAALLEWYERRKR